MWTYIPQRLPTGSPLVVVLHGCGQTASAYANGAGWCELADRFGFSVVAPEQTSQNNPNGCFNWFQSDDTTRGVGEAASIKQMIDTMIRNHGSAADRVFVTGLSAGGAMTSVMLATYPETFAGGAIIAGLPYAAATTLPDAFRAMQQPAERSPKEWGDAVRRASSYHGPRPKVSVWHGDADFTVSVLNAEASIDQWTDVLGVSGSAAREELTNAYSHRVWSNANGTAVLEAYTIKGMGHGTPILTGSSADACGTPGPFILSAGIPSSVRIAEFFGLSAAAANGGELVFAGSISVDAASNSAPPPLPGWVPKSAPAESRGTNIGHVISDALRAAGLLK